MLFPQVFLPLLGLASLGSCAGRPGKDAKSQSTVTVTQDPNPGNHSTVTVTLGRNSTYIPPSCTKKVKGLAKTQACHTYTVYTQSRECSKHSCPLQTHKACPKIVKATTTTVPCSTDCCPVTATTTITTKCASCPTGCPIQTETVTVATGCPGGNVTKHTKHSVMTRTHTVTLPKSTSSSKAAKAAKSKSSKASSTRSSSTTAAPSSPPPSAPAVSPPPVESQPPASGSIPPASASAV